MGVSCIVKSCRAFTLIELLVVISITGLLITLLLPALGAARKQCLHLKMSAGLREMMHGYTMYHGDHKGWLLWGYTPPTVQGVPVVVVDAVSGHSFGLPVADRYPWRLSNHVGNLWNILHAHGPRPVVPLAQDDPAKALDSAYRLSIHPSFGINSVYVGGHHSPLFKGFAGPGGDTPNMGKHVVFREHEVNKPSSLLVFAENLARNGPFTDPLAGLHFVMPPRAGGLRWQAAGDGFELMSAVVTGLPQSRFSRATPTAFFDGHVKVLTSTELEDMRLWSNTAQGPDDDPVP